MKYGQHITTYMYMYLTWQLSHSFSALSVVLKFGENLCGTVIWARKSRQS